MKYTVFIVLFIYSSIFSTEKGLYFSQDIIACYNPLGGLFDSRLSYRIPLVKKKGILWESTKIDIGIQNEWTPADNFFGLRIQIEPIAFFDIFVRFGCYVMYDNMIFGYYGFADKNSNYDDETLENMESSSEQGYFIGISPTLKGQIGRVVFFNTLNINRFSLNTNEYFLELRSNAMHYSEDLQLWNESFLLFEVNDKIMTGFNYSMIRVIKTVDRSRKINFTLVCEPKVKKVNSMYFLILCGLYFTDRVYKNNFYLGAVFGFEAKVRKKIRQD